MSRSSIQGVKPAPAQPAGRDTASLGPGDTSDSGSDMMGVADDDGGDPGLPTDLAFDDNQSPRTLSPDTLDANSDAVGTGESRSAGGDGGKPDGWDIGVDQVINPEVTEDADEDADVAFIEDADAGDALFEGEDENEDEDAEEDDDDAATGPRS